jgi:putative ABC transport system permease protein
MFLASDLRLAGRMFVRQPGLSFLAVLALGLGIGLSTIMFTIIEGVFLRGLPFEEADRIVGIGASDANQGAARLPLSQHEFLDVRARARTVTHVSAMRTGTVNLSGPEGRPERYDGGFMTADAFGVPRVPALLGRTFVTGDDEVGAPPVVVLGHAIWRDRFHADPAVVGRMIRINGVARAVVGVMPEGFRYPGFQDLWVPLVIDVSHLERGEGPSVMVTARVAPGYTLDEARAELATIAKSLAIEHPASNSTRTFTVTPYIEQFLRADAARFSYTMLVSVFGVLLVACANVANLLLARAALRTKEMAVRSALGASRWRMTSQLVSESLVLAIAGAGLGLGLAQAGITLFNRATVDTDPPFWIDVRFDPKVLAFVAAITVVSGLLAGAIPAWQSARRDANETLKDASRGASGFRMSRFSTGLVMAEIALSCGLLVASGLIIKSVVNLKATDFGFATTNVFTARLALFETDYPDNWARARFYADLEARLERVPGALAVALATDLPASGSSRTAFAVEGATYATDDDYPVAREVSVSPGFFRTLGRQVTSGRDFSASDDERAPGIVIVNRSFAERYFPGEDPIGRRIRTGRSDSTRPWRTVVGVAPDLYMGDIDNRTPAGFYTPMAQDSGPYAAIMIRAAGAPAALSPAVRDAVAAIDPDLPVYRIAPLIDRIREDDWPYEVFGSLFVAFGAAALVLATAGLYGVVAFSVGRRTHEIGLRVALGATRYNVVAMVLRQGAVEVGVGLGAGLAIAGGFSLVMRDMLYDVQPWDATVFLLVATTLAVASLVACLVPARRAMRLDPMVALRRE